MPPGIDAPPQHFSEHGRGRNDVTHTTEATRCDQQNDDVRCTAWNRINSIDAKWLASLSCSNNSSHKQEQKQESILHTYCDVLWLFVVVCGIWWCQCSPSRDCFAAHWHRRDRRLRWADAGDAVTFDVGHRRCQWLVPCPVWRRLMWCCSVPDSLCATFAPCCRLLMLFLLRFRPLLCVAQCVCFLSNFLFWLIGVFFYWFGRKREMFDCRAKVSLHTKIRKRRRYNFTIFARTRGLSKKSIHYMIWTVATSIHTQQLCCIE